MSKKIIYIVPFYNEKTDTHLYYNYRLIQELEHRGMELTVLKAKELGFVKLLLKLFGLRRRGYRNAYVHYSFYGALAAILTGCRVFYWNRGLPWLFKRSFFEEQIFRFILRRSILVTGPESLAKEYQKRYGIREYRTVSNWIDVKRFTPQTNKKTEPRIILFVHHLSKRKGADLVISIAEGFNEKNLEFWVIGDGPERLALKLQIRSRQLPVPIKFLGKIPNSNLPPYFKQASVFLMPSREEGSPHVLLEAMAAGTPFVATDVGAVKELLTPALEKFLCPAADIQCFQKKIRALLSDQELYNEARKQGMEQARKFDIQKGVLEFIELFKK